MTTTTSIALRCSAPPFPSESCGAWGRGTRLLNARTPRGFLESHRVTDVDKPIEYSCGFNYRNKVSTRLEKFRRCLHTRSWDKMELASGVGRPQGPSKGDERARRSPVSSRIDESASSPDSRYRASSSAFFRLVCRRNSEPPRRVRVRRVTSSLIELSVIGDS